MEKRQLEVKKDVLRFQEREKHLKRVLDLELKRPWVEFEEQRRTALDVTLSLPFLRYAKSFFCFIHNFFVLPIINYLVGAKSKNCSTSRIPTI